jgi:hypothetical protein
MDCRLIARTLTLTLGVRGASSILRAHLLLEIIFVLGSDRLLLPRKSKVYHWGLDPILVVQNVQVRLI